MGLNDKSDEWSHLIQSFRHAFSGIGRAILAERNLKIHCAAAVIVMILAFVLHVSDVEKLILLIVIGAVISLELVNTAVERAVDLITSENHPLAKFAKDAASGAVLFFVILAVIIGLMIFLPYLF